MKTKTGILTVLFLFTLTIKNTQAMEKKKVEKTTVLMYSLKSTLATIATDAGNIPNELMIKAQALGLEIAGPQIWQYRNVDGNPTSTFDLDICVPIKEAKGEAGKFKFDVLPEISCVSEIHKGPYVDLKNVYDRMMGEISRKGIIPGNMSREVYIVCDFEDQSKCVTEVQWVINY